MTDQSDTAKTTHFGFRDLAEEDAQEGVPTTESLQMPDELKKLVMDLGAEVSSAVAWG